MTSDTRIPSTPLPAGLILAGGRSSRMGSDKATIRFAGRHMIAHVTERLAPQVSDLAINAPPDFSGHMGLPLVPDVLAGHQGPLAGILSGLRHFAGSASHLRMASAPADGPFLPTDLVTRLASACPDEATIAVASSRGHMHPVYALWPLSLADDLEAWLADPDNRRIKAFLSRHPVAIVEFDLETTMNGDRDPFFNINTPEDLSRAEQFLDGS